VGGPFWPSQKGQAKDDLLQVVAWYGWPLQKHYPNSIPFMIYFGPLWFSLRNLKSFSDLQIIADSSGDRDRVENI
jgi:hypothetical protein